MTAYWRAAGLSYLKYVSLCSEFMRNALKEPAMQAAKAREAVYYKNAVWVNGKPDSTVIVDTLKGKAK